MNETQADNHKKVYSLSVGSRLLRHKFPNVQMQSWASEGFFAGVGPPGDFSKIFQGGPKVV